MELHYFAVALQAVLAFGQPDRFDLIGAGISLVGVTIIIWGRTWFY